MKFLVIKISKKKQRNQGHFTTSPVPNAGTEELKRHFLLSLKTWWHVWTLANEKAFILLFFPKAIYVLRQRFSRDLIQFS